MGTATLNRLSGLFLAGLGILLLLIVIPQHTETVDYGWLRPQTVPNATAWVILLCGLAQALRPGGAIEFSLSESARAAMYLALVVIGVVFISRFGFVRVGPVLALAIMLVMGERRPHWLFFGVVLLPASIWLVVAVLLGRPLP